MDKKFGEPAEIDALRLSEQRFQAIWDAAADAMAVSDPDGIVLDANPAYYNLYGYAPDAVLGNSFAIIFPEDQRVAAVATYKELFQQRTDIPAYESTIRRADGSERIVEARATFIHLGNNQDALLSIIRDVTARKQLESERDQLLIREQAARVEAETALRIRDQFLAVAAHELRTPLTVLRGYTELLSRRIASGNMLSERDQQTIHIIDSQAQRLYGLIDSFLDIQRIQAGALSIERWPLELCSLVRELVEENQPASQQNRIQLECQADPLIIVGDARRLAQVVQNLLQNALKYSAAGDPVWVRVDRHENRARLVVRDQGIGIPEAAQPNLFRQFYRAPNVTQGTIQGMGIGLYVVKEIVERHDGTISVESREGAGSSFTVSFPLYIAKSSS
jgi:PAS domain S-box-containing protein